MELTGQVRIRLASMAEGARCGAVQLEHGIDVGLQPAALTLRVPRSSCPSSNAIAASLPTATRTGKADA